MKRIVSILTQTITDSSVRYVFPSEVAASFWRREALRISTRVAVRSERFLSWDSFKEEAFSVHREEKPANRLVRMLFASAILQENSDTTTSPSGPLFKTLINPDYTDNSPAFLRYLVSVLPTLSRLDTLGEHAGAGSPGDDTQAPAGADSPGEATEQKAPTGEATEQKAPIDRDLIEDLHLLRERYTRFLDENGYFEPNFEELKADEVSGHVYVFFPELLDDFAGYADMLEATPRVTVVSTDAGDSTEEASPAGAPGATEEGNRGGAPEITDSLFRVFENSLHEVRWTLSSIVTLLEAGVHPEDIAITGADPNVVDLLQREARLYDVPLSVKLGKPLSEYPAGRLFSLLNQCVTTDFSIDALKQLLLHCGYPWKDPQAGRDLIRFGIEQFCARNLPHGGGGMGAGATGDSATGKPAARGGATDERAGKAGPARQGVWLERLKRSGDKQLEGLYKTLSGVILGIVRAADFMELKKNINGFVHHFLDNEQWDETGLKVFQRCFTVLDDLHDAFSPMRTAKGVKGVRPFHLFLTALEERVYVPAVPDGGVPVYPYRVSAGIDPQFHFIVGASQAATRITVSHYPFLREDHKQRLGLQDPDLSDDFLRLYLESGKCSVLSCSRESLAGRELVPSYFISLQVRSAGEDSRETDEQGPTPGASAESTGPAEQGPDCYTQERAYWADPSSPLPSRLAPLQREGLEYMAVTGFSERSEDYTGERIGNRELCESLVQLQREESGMVPVTTGRIETYQACGFLYLLRYVLGIEEEPYRFSYYDPPTAGSFTHRVLADLFTVIKERDGTFHPDHLEQYQGMIDRVMRTSERRWKKRRPVFFPPVWEQFLLNCRGQAERHLEVEADTFPSYAVDAVEKTVQIVLDGHGDGGDGDGHGEALLVAGSPVVLKGRMDRIAEKDGRYGVIDYKTRQSFPKSVYLGDEETLPGSYQLPFYVYLLEASGKPVDSCSLYILTDGEYKHLYREGAKAWADREQVEELVGTMFAQIKRLAEGIESGDYMVEENECGGCPYRPVCRARYALG